MEEETCGSMGQAALGLLALLPGPPCPGILLEAIQASSLSRAPPRGESSLCPFAPGCSVRGRGLCYCGHPYLRLLPTLWPSAWKQGLQDNRQRPAWIETLFCHHQRWLHVAQVPSPASASLLWQLLEIWVDVIFSFSLSSLFIVAAVIMEIGQGLL